MKKITTPPSSDAQADEHKIIDFPNPPDDELRKAKAEAERLANQPEVERAFRIPTSAATLGIDVAVLRSMVHAVLKAKSELVAAEHLKQDRDRQQNLREKKVEDQKQEKAEKEKSRKQEQAEKAAKLAKEKVEKAAKVEAERKAKEKQKGFSTILRLPVAGHDAELAKLAKLLGEDVTALRQELKGFAGVTEGMATRETEPWPEAVDLPALLAELGGKIARYVAIPQTYQMDAALLWVAHCWTYDHEVPIHSPLLAVTSAEPDSGKSTLVTVLGHATPRFKLGVEMTGPTLFRFIDQHKPTLALDEADDIFKRRTDLKHVINQGWTRGAKIPRMEKIGGVLRTVWFDPFTPKAVALLGSNLPQATRTRCIELRMVPKRQDETVDEFNETDDIEFATLRRKFSRWAGDNAAALKQAKPIIMPGLNNRAAANWKLLLAIAELAGGSWPERAREAAERLNSWPFETEQRQAVAGRDQGHVRHGQEGDHIRGHHRQADRRSDRLVGLLQSRWAGHAKAGCLAAWSV